ncbi:MAG: hypothetical protein K9H61_13000 [Bacteroidia bacterium]|nr:hypothetical protein [Bacteroidia bacterium]MCF8427551.1 hypothetical protein [Bacteroidia bacterium]MCF8447900.1 hypothetical protein [Bacteroidia bacterium]
MSGKYKLIIFLLLLVTAASTSKSECLSNEFHLDLYGHPLKFSGANFGSSLSVPYTKEKINKYLNGLDQTEIASYVSQMDIYSAQFGMDDMAYLLLTKKLSLVLGTNLNSSKLLQYKLLKAKGYNLILGYSENQLTDYAYLGFNVLNCTYVSHQGLTYTDISFDQKLEPCNEELFESAKGGRAILINDKRAPFYDAKRSSYSYYFEFDGKVYFFNGTLNQSLAEYYRELPDIEFGSIYQNYQLSDIAKGELIADLKDAMAGMYSSKQIDFLLTFTQEAIPYKTDLLNVGKEKFAFPEEVLFNQYGDCEDKSVLFAYLAKEVLQLPSLALIYFHQNHLNVAVAISDKSGYNFIYNNQKYLVCEPSGIGFAPGDNIYDVNKASIVNW